MSPEILSDGSRVWVNNDQGMCVGRFSLAGVDIHKDYAAQASGEGQCLDCIPGPTDLKAWRIFQTLMHRHYSVGVDDTHMPQFVRSELNKRS
jgi:hypothetical protein